MKKTIYLLTIFLIESKKIIAYIDPGTTGMVVSSSIWPWITGIFAVVLGFLAKFLFKPTKRGILLIWKKIIKK